MASITIKNIPDKLYEQLKQSAKAHHRSLNGELIVCLEKVLAPSRISPSERISTARLLRQRVQAVQLTATEINDAKNSGRP